MQVMRKNGKISSLEGEKKDKRQEKKQVLLSCLFYFFILFWRECRLEISLGLEEFVHV